LDRFENEDWPSGPALEYKVPVGTLACPHCGAVINGAIYKPVCCVCGKLYWQETIQEE